MNLPAVLFAGRDAKRAKTYVASKPWLHIYKRMCCTGVFYLRPAVELVRVAVLPPAERVAELAPAERVEVAALEVRVGVLAPIERVAALEVRILVLDVRVAALDVRVVTLGVTVRLTDVLVVLVVRVLDTLRPAVADVRVAVVPVVRIAVFPLLTDVPALTVERVPKLRPCVGVSPIR